MMMGSHPGGRITACSVRCSILEYIMEMLIAQDITNIRWGVGLGSLSKPVTHDSFVMQESVTSCLPVVLLSSSGGCQFFREIYGTDLIHRIHLRTRVLSMSSSMLFVIRFRAIQLHMITQMHLFFRFLKSIQLMLRRTSTGAVQATLFCICFKISVGQRDSLILLQDDGSTGSILFAMRHHETHDAKKKKLGPQDTEEGLNRSRYTLD
ncbi:hypothetical protein YC2023_015919 [Brassica napus]